MEVLVSTTLIVALVVGGLVIVIGLGFFSQAMERARLERARALAELQARWNHCNGINNSLPGQFMTAGLKQQLLKIEANLLQRLVKLDSRNNRAAAQLIEVRKQLSQSEMRVANAPLTINTEVAALEARRQLNELLRLFDLARRETVLDEGDYQHWSKYISQQQREATLN